MKKIILLSALLVASACGDKSHDDHKEAANKTVKALEDMGGKVKGATKGAADHATGAVAAAADATKGAVAATADATKGAAAATADAAKGAAAATADAAKGAADTAKDAVAATADAAKGAVVNAKAMAEAKTIFTTRCVACHGATGKGDGAAAAALNPKPRAYNDKAWQKSVNDDFLAKVILKGGAAVGKSPLMPGNADLEKKPEVVAGLVAMIRGFGK